MIVRLVKMTFRPEESARFQALFEDWRHRIIAMPGCLRLELLHGTDDGTVFFTYSEWVSVDHLEHYRNSAVFSSVWPVVKSLFAERAQAWTMDREHHMTAAPTPFPV
jgi:quinol monooxygenase YgiN